MFCPATDEHQVGDYISKAAAGRAAGAGQDGSSKDGDGEDDFVFTLTQGGVPGSVLRGSWSLPNLEKRKLTQHEGAVAVSRAGFSTDGAPAKLAYVRTMRNSLARRIALKRPKNDEKLQRLRKRCSPPRRGRRRRRRRACASKLRLSEHRPAKRASPISIRSICAIGGMRTGRKADDAGGDVLPDGRLGLDDGGAEGPRQALLHAALRVPVAPLRGDRRSSSSGTPAWPQEVDEDTFFRGVKTGGTVDFDRT